MCASECCANVSVVCELVCIPERGHAVAHGVDISMCCYGVCSSECVCMLCACCCTYLREDMMSRTELPITSRTCNGRGVG